MTLVCDVYPSGASKLQIADDLASLLKSNLVEAVDREDAEHMLVKRNSASYFKRESLEETRKSTGRYFSRRIKAVRTLTKRTTLAKMLS